MRAIGYVRVSTDRQQVEGVSLEAQKAAIGEEVTRRGWELVDIAGDVASGKTIRKRVGLVRAMERIEAREADALVVSRLDRLSRSFAGIGDLLERAEQKRWVLVVMDPPVDLSTPFGRAMAGMAGVFAQLERELIGQRTRESIAAKIAAGGTHGMKRKISPETERTILRMHKRGRSQRQICDLLDAEAIPAPMGGRWARSTVAMVIARS